MTTPPAPPPFGGQPPQQPGWGQPAPQWGPPPGQEPPHQPAQPHPGPPRGQPHAGPPHPGPPQGPPYPGPPYPGPQPGGPFQGGPGLPPQGPPRGRTSKGAKALIAAVGLGIAGVVVAGVVASTSAPAGAEVGECVAVNAVELTDADVEKVDCADPGAAYRVAANLDSGTAACPDGDYSEYREAGGRRSDGFKLCLMLNAEEGDCFKDEGNGISARITKVACASGADFQVTKVVDRVDEEVCGQAEAAEVYSSPATTLCLGQPKVA